ncbi:MAG: hypothetical protein WCO14_00990 [bacterium]
MIKGGAPGERMLNAFLRGITKGLLVWAGISVAAGILLLSFAQTPFWGGFALQCFLWAIIDAAIALWGWWRERRALPPLTARAVWEKAEQLRRNLLWNAGLDLLYITLGVLLITLWGVNSAIGQGHGAGIIVQGSFLLIFDLGQSFLLGRQMKSM